jgi:hypothetical protein
MNRDPQSVGMVIFVLLICACAYFARASWRACLSSEFRRDLERLREQRRRSKAARRY